MVDVLPAREIGAGYVVCLVLRRVDGRACDPRARSVSNERDEMSALEIMGVGEGPDETRRKLTDDGMERRFARKVLY